MKCMTFGLAAFLAIGVSAACLAEDLVAAEQSSASKLALQLKPGLSNATLSVTGPNEFHTSIQSKNGSLAVDLAQLGPLANGLYTYQVTASSGEKTPIKPPRVRLDNGRDREIEVTKSVAMSGTFNIVDGKIVKPDPTIREERRR